MPDRVSLKYRRLPDGEFLAGYEVGWDGALLELGPAVSDRLPAVGDLLEIECGPALYLGEVKQWRGSTAIVLVEHSLDRARLSALETTWGQPSDGAG